MKDHDNWPRELLTMVSRDLMRSDRCPAHCQGCRKGRRRSRYKRHLIARGCNNPVRGFLPVLENLVEGRVVNRIQVKPNVKRWARVALDRMLG